MPYLGHPTKRDLPPTPGEKYRRYLADRARILAIHGAMSNNVARAFNSIQPLGNPNAGRSGGGFSPGGGGVASPGGGGDGVGGAFNDPGFTSLPGNPPPIRGGTNLIDYFDALRGGSPLTPSGLPSAPPTPASAPPTMIGGEASQPATSSSSSVRNAPRNAPRRISANGGNRGFSGNSVFK